MKIIGFKDYESLSMGGADIIAETMNSKENCTLGLATGSSPIGIYENLVKLNKEGKIDFSKVSTANLDEYVGLDETNDQSYRYFMNYHLFDHVNIDKSKTFVPTGKAEDFESICLGYEKIIEDLGGVDLQLLGIGLNGHIGFNEPNKEFTKITNVVELTESTRQANKRFFNSIDEVPTHAVTMGIGTIMKAKKILMVVNGKNKAQIVKDAFFGPVTPQVPASILQFHQDFTLIADEEALSLVK